ncbi:MAG: TRAP transporter small permease subunit [Steroidobacteraceae bacterium]|nr:TRAP transporter small permease subunit [Steroidobacteraceae bacterium]
MNRLLSGLDALAEWTGRAVSWLTLAMVVATVAVVVLRYAAGVGLIWLQESVNWMHALVFMLGAAYTLKADEHVRVDVFYRRMSERGRAIVDLAGTLLFLLPLCAFLIVESWPWVAASWRVAERSREAGGLPMLYLLKSLIPLMAALLALQGIAGGLRAWLRLRAAGRV